MTDDPIDKQPSDPNNPGSSPGSNSGGNAGGGNPDDGLIRGQVRHQQISARVPESVARGVFSTGAIVLMGNTEFVLDFLLRMQRPHQVVARVILPHPVLPQMIQALETNLGKYEERFGKPPEMPKPEPGASRPSIEEVYDDLKLPDDELAGHYANSVMISHSPAEFCFDFICNFFPKSSVSSRVFVSAPQVPRLLDAIKNTYQEFQKRLIANRKIQIDQQRQTQQPPPIVNPQEPNPYYPPKSPNDTDSTDDSNGRGTRPPDAA